MPTPRFIVYTLVILALARWLDLLDEGAAGSPSGAAVVDAVTEPD